MSFGTCHPQDEVTAQLVTEFEPDSVIYNIEEYNRICFGVLTIDGCCLFEVFGQLMDFLGRPS